MRKELERLFEFDDLLNRVHDALTQQDNTTLVELLRERFRFGLIDEFQDTDDKQWDIFRRIFVGHQNGALYIIGDPKQAIYGFREPTFIPISPPVTACSPIPIVRRHVCH